MLDGQYLLQELVVDSRVPPRSSVAVLSCHAGVVNGGDLARQYYESVVAPLLAEFDGGMAHAAGRLGQGSDVLGFDDAMSRDHDWGLRLTLLVEAEHVATLAEFIESRLPTEYLGYPTRFPLTTNGETRHRIDIDTAQQFSFALLGVDATSELTVPEWLSLSGQSILEVIAGPLFEDSLGTITTIRHQLRWYPDDLWRHVVAKSWARLAEELPLVGRAGMRGDELGSSVIGARLVSIAMHLGFQLERTWAPYPKWFGTAFQALPNASACTPALSATLSATSWQDRETHLVHACKQLYEFQRTTALPTVDGPMIEPFHDRPFPTVSQTAIDALTTSTLPGASIGVGSIDQWTDNVALLTAPAQRLPITQAMRSDGYSAS